MTDPDIALLKLPAENGVFGLGFRFTSEHADDEFKRMPHHMNRYYGDCEMPETIYKTIFRDPDNRTHIVPEAYTIINDWYSNKIVERSVHDPASPVGVTVLDNVKRIPIFYMYRTEDYGAIRNSKDVAECIDYHHSETNLC